MGAGKPKQVDGEAGYSTCRNQLFKQDLSKMRRLAWSKEIGSFLVTQMLQEPGPWILLEIAIARLFEDEWPNICAS